MYVSDLKRLRNADSRGGQVPSFVVFVLFSVMPALFPLIVPALLAESAPLSMVLKAFNLCLTSAVISITSLLNFSLAATLAVLVGGPVTIASSSPLNPTRFARYAASAVLALGWLAFYPEETSKALWNWEVLGVWLAPFVCVVYTPLVLQSALVCLLL